MTRLPDFLIIGAARAGTTALHSYLRQAPDVFMPDAKEPNFFAYEGQTLAVQGPGAGFINNSLTRLEDYAALFADAPDGAICGEASPLYLYEPTAPGNILRHLPDARLVAILRNPIEQAFSHFLYASRLRVETLDSFTEALGREGERRAQGWQPLFGYSAFPRYGKQLARYFALFPREQFLIRTYEEFEQSPEAVVSDILAFIGADTRFVPDMSQRLNAGAVPKSRMIQDFLMKPNPLTGAVGLVVPERTRRRIRDWLAKFNETSGTSMPPAARSILHERLDEDIRQLEDLIERDLSAWRRPEAVRS